MEQISLTEQHLSQLFRIPLFNDLPLNLKNSFVEKLDYTVYAIRKNDTVARQHTLCRQLMILLAGKLRVDAVDASGNEVLIEYIVAPRAFATPYLFNAGNMLPATFKSEGDGVLLMATKDSFFTLFTDALHLLKNFLCVVGNCNKCSDVRLRALSYKNIRSRFISYLMQQRNGEEATVAIEHNQVELADYLCVSRPALTKEINKMERENLIHIKGKMVGLLNIPELKRAIL